MTVKQKQHLLAYLGYYSGTVDGIWGAQSQRATEAFQRDYQLTADGDFGNATAQRIREVIYNQEEIPTVSEKETVKTTGTFWDEIEFFTRDEFKCQCGGKYCNGFHVEPEETMVRICDEIRRRAGVPILIRDAGGSGLRCPQHNASIPGAAANSEHTHGRAADLHPRGKTPAQLYAIAEAVMAEMIPGRGGLGLYNWGIHVDTGKYSRWIG